MRSVTDVSSWGALAAEDGPEGGLARRVGVWLGSVFRIEADGLVYGTNETVCPFSGPAAEVLHAGGPELKQACAQEGHIDVGNMAISPGFNLPYHHVAHVVGPRYSKEFEYAAVHATHSCIKKSLQSLYQHGCRTVIIGHIHLEHRGFPLELATETALRTVHQCLVQLPALDRVLFVVDTAEASMAFREQLVRYFPRTTQEAASRGPWSGYGDAWGDLVLEERRIPIGRGIQHHHSHHHAMGRSLVGMQEAPVDEEGADTFPAAWSGEHRTPTPREEFDQLLQRSNTAQLGAMAALHFIYHSGFDDAGRPIIVVHINVLLACSDSENRLLYSIRVLHPMVEQHYILIVLGASASSLHLSHLAGLATLLRMLPVTYHGNLHRVLVVQPGFAVRALATAAALYLDADLLSRVAFPASREELLAAYPGRALRLGHRRREHA